MDLVAPVLGLESSVFDVRRDEVLRGDSCEVTSSVSWRVLDIGGQATKGAWGMSWRQKTMKGVEGCEKPGGAVKRALIPGFPNWLALNP